MQKIIWIVIFLKFFLGNETIILAQNQSNSILLSQLSQPEDTKIKRIRILGNTVFKDFELNKITNSFIGEPSTLTTIREIEAAITNFTLDEDTLPLVLSLLRNR
ncbi:MAG: hypothetical protein HC820_05760 [Hydrococcus sp. RM1_1_31]|nr:hypothetical protein [Hydrococcus sp. RM1_1_31]